MTNKNDKLQKEVEEIEIENAVETVLKEAEEEGINLNYKCGG
ncbi:hypothetical protein [Bacillus cereus]|nr:hypothetical protein [Bacillus cereus]MDA2092105.1 hypothetical protein [Bacillus cereus]WJX06321.1 hypothetical protein QTA68_05550 [Bacillus cereus]